MFVCVAGEGIMLERRPKCEVQRQAEINKDQWLLQRTLNSKVDAKTAEHTEHKQMNR